MGCLQVPQVKAKALTISLVPADVGKPTVRLEKAVIVDGTCFWENPVYETVKLIRDPKTRGFIEKKYHFIVSSVRHDQNFGTCIILVQNLQIKISKRSSDTLKSCRDHQKQVYLEKYRSILQIMRRQLHLQPSPFPLRLQTMGELEQFCMLVSLSLSKTNS